jgi:uncharacterized protein
MAKDPTQGKRATDAAAPRSTHRDPRRVDITAVSRSQAQLQGEWPADELERLKEETHEREEGASQRVRWQAKGFVHQGLGVVDQPGLHLLVDANIVRTCQRCMKPMQLSLHVDRRFLFAATEALAAELDDLTDHDVLVTSRTLDLRDLVEDELLLALPVVALHETCPVSLAKWMAPAVDDASSAANESTGNREPQGAKNNPFQALAVLKKNPAPKP